MAQISSLGAGIYSQFAISNNATSYTQAAIDTAASAGTLAAFETLVGTQHTTTSGSTDAEFVNQEKVREFPSVGVPANIVNVPVFGQGQSDQIQGQSDAPSLEFTINYVPADHAVLNSYAGDGIRRVFRLRMANGDLPNSILASTEHSDFYWVGQVASFNVTPNLTDANTATFSVTIEGRFYGPLTTV